MNADERNVYERALEIAVEARTLARAAHDRQDAMDDAITAIRDAIGSLQQSVAKLNTKVAFASTFGSLIGGGAVAVAVSYFH